MYYDLSQSRLQNELRQRSGDGRSKGKLWYYTDIYMDIYVKKKMGEIQPNWQIDMVSVSRPQNCWFKDTMKLHVERSGYTN